MKLANFFTCSMRGGLAITARRITSPKGFKWVWQKNNGLKISVLAQQDKGNMGCDNHQKALM